MKKINKEKWMNLYELADEIYDIAPWNYLSDSEIITYVDRKTQKLYYLFVLGKGGMCKGLVIIHEDNILEYLNIMENGFQPLQLLNYQIGFMITYPNKNTIEADDKIIPSALGIGFDDEWIVFKYYEKGYLPMNLNDDMVEILSPLLENYLVILKHIKNREIELPIENDKMLARYYSDDLKGYNNVVIPKLFPEFSYKMIDISDEYKDRINSLKKRHKEYEIDFMNYLPISIGDNYKNGRYKLNFYIAISDRLERKMIDFKIIDASEYNDDINAYYKYAASKIIEYFEVNSLPSKIYVRDNITKSIINELFNNCNIEVVRMANLYVVDGYLSMLVKKK